MSKTKIKGIYKGIKYFSQIFVPITKEKELEIGYPTDVKHVAHIGWDGASASSPSWMNEFQPGPEFSAPSLGRVAETRDTSSVSTSTKSPQDYEGGIGDQTESNILTNVTSKKVKRKKTRSTSSPRTTATRSKTVKSKASKDSKLNLELV